MGKVSYKPVAQRLEIVSDTLVLLNGLLGAAVYESTASAPKGPKGYFMKLAQDSQNLTQAFQRPVQASLRLAQAS